MSPCNVSEAGLIGCDELFMPRFNEANASVNHTHESRLTLLTHMKLWVADGLPIGRRIVRINRGRLQLHTELRILQQASPRRG